MLTCLRTCNKTPWTVPPKRWRSTTLRRTSPPTSRRSSTKSTTRRGTASWAAISAPTSRTRPNTSFTSIWDKLPFCSSSPDKRNPKQLSTQSQPSPTQPSPATTNHFLNDNNNNTKTHTSTSNSIPF